MPKYFAIMLKHFAIMFRSDRKAIMLKFMPALCAKA